MKGFTKKAMVGTVVASMVMSSSLVAFAADPTPAETGTSGGSGEIEGVVDTSVYNAVLPTESTTAYDYIVDPQGLIRKTNAAKYEGKEFGEGTVFFENVNGSTSSYSNTSDAATIVNKSSKNLSVTVTATATPDGATGAATLATSKTFGDANTNLEVYLGITDSVEGSTEKALTEAGAEMKAVLGAAPEGAYEYKYDSTTQKYSYALKSDVSAFTFADYSFQINGAANANGTWKADTAVPAVSVKWDVDVTDDAATVETPTAVGPSISDANKTYPASSNTAVNVNINLGSGDLAAEGISSLTYKNKAGEVKTVESSGYSYNSDKGVLTIAPATVDAFVNSTSTTREYTITFKDTAKTKATFTLTK